MSRGPGRCSSRVRAGRRRFRRDVLVVAAGGGDRSFIVRRPGALSTVRCPSVPLVDRRRFAVAFGRPASASRFRPVVREGVQAA
ncbi:hypothetical protein C8039_14200 [Halogeometricum sp. wsp3]|nr:hypothetical protein C8039_14200 [Halogeometricum sp. wsp3]